MNGWVDGWISGWMGIRMAGETDKWIDGDIDGKRGDEGRHE